MSTIAEATPGAVGAAAGWYSDPTHRGDHRYWDGQAWTDQISKQGQARKDRRGTRGITAEMAPNGSPIVAPTTESGEAAPPEGAAGEASTVAGSPAAVAAVDGTQEQPETSTAVPEPMGDIPVGSASATSFVTRPVTLRAWIAVAAAVGLLVVGVLIGVLTQQSSLSSKNSTISALTSQRDAARGQVNNRAARQAADNAAAQRIAAQQQQAQQQAAAAAAAAAQQQAAAAAAAAAKMNTVPAGGGVYAIGTDINPGTWTTSGPNGSNGAGCYYAILNSSNTQDIATNNISQGQQVATLSVGQYFDTQGCQAWTRQG